MYQLAALSAGKGDAERLLQLNIIGEHPKILSLADSGDWLNYIPSLTSAFYVNQGDYTLDVKNLSPVVANSTTYTNLGWVALVKMDTVSQDANGIYTVLHEAEDFDSVRGETTMESNRGETYRFEKGVDVRSSNR